MLYLTLFSDIGQIPPFGAQAAQVAVPCVGNVVCLFEFRHCPSYVCLKERCDYLSSSTCLPAKCVRIPCTFRMAILCQIFLIPCYGYFGGLLQQYR